MIASVELQLPFEGLEDLPTYTEVLADYGYVEQPDGKIVSAAEVTRFAQPFEIGRHRTHEVPIIKQTSDTETRPWSWFGPTAHIRGPEPTPHTPISQPPQLDPTPEPYRPTVIVPVMPGFERAIGRAQVAPRARMAYNIHPQPETSPQTAAVAVRPTVGQRGHWQTTGNPEQERRIDAFLSQEQEHRPSGRLMRLAQRIGNALTRAAMPVLEEHTEQTEKQLAPRSHRRSPHSHTNGSTSNPQSALIVEATPPSAPKPAALQPAQRGHDTKSNPVFERDHEDSDAVRRMRAFYEDDREINEPNRYQGSHRLVGERRSFLKFMARSLGYTAIGGGIAVGSFWSATNPEKVANAIDAARQLAESVLSY